MFKTSGDFHREFPIGGILLNVAQGQEGKSGQKIAGVLFVQVFCCLDLELPLKGNCSFFLIPCYYRILL